ncbi:MAG: phosphoglycerate mutase [bacterium]|nr:phosphoglycerate mutase [bacterium]MCP4964714.1 phosphoglycerate mutase [bacterium]
MRLYLIRHAVTPETGKRLSSVDPSISLSAAGQSMARELGEHLSPIKLEAIYSSPMQRCRETASAVAKGRGLRVRVDKAFTEADFGTWLGRPLRSLYKLKAWQELMISASRFRFPEGETLEEVQRRSVAGVEHLADQHKGATIAVATHADIIRVVLAHYLGMPLDLVHRLDAGPASVSVVDLHPSGHVQVPIMNHVGDPGRWR